MAYAEDLAARIRIQLIERENYVEKKLFGGICFMLQGNMACGIIHDYLISRVGPGAYAAALEQPHAAIFDFTGRPMRGWVQIAPAGTRSATELAEWIEKGVAFALSLPPK